MKGKPTRGKAVDEELAISLYKQGLSANEVGRRLGHPHGVILYHLYKRGVPVQRVRLQHPEISTEQLKQWYQEGMSTLEISQKIGITAQSVYQRLLKAGIPLRSFSKAITLASQRGRKRQQTGDKNARWKGGRSLTTDGYIEVRIDGKQCPEHRVVWEKAHGVIPKGWVIHHLNGKRDDNRLENLCALQRKRHSPTEIIKPHQKRIRQLEMEIYKLQHNKD